MPMFSQSSVYVSVNIFCKSSVRPIGRRTQLKIHIQADCQIPITLRRSIILKSYIGPTVTLADCLLHDGFRQDVRTLLLRDFVGILIMIPKIQDMKMQKLYIFFEHFCEMWTLSAKAKKETMIFHTRPPGVLINTFDPFCNFRGSRIHLQ